MTIWVPLQHLSWNWGGVANGSGTIMDGHKPRLQRRKCRCRLYSTRLGSCHRSGKRRTALLSYITNMKGAMMKNKKAAMLTIFAGALFPVACLGQTPQVVHPAGTKPNPNSIKHAVKTNEAKTDLAPKSGTLARLRPMDPEVSQALGRQLQLLQSRRQGAWPRKLGGSQRRLS